MYKKSETDSGLAYGIFDTYTFAEAPVNFQYF